MKQRYIIIGFWALLSAASAIIVNTSLVEERSGENFDVIAQPDSNTLPAEEEVFKLADKALELKQLLESGQNVNKELTAYYSRRAYPGAPPVIPHPAGEERSPGGKDCLQCHRHGDYAPAYGAFAPITPHPELISCKQCHVPVTTTGNFVANTWSSTAAPGSGQQALPGSPPVITHGLQMRSNCLACHASSATPAKIRVTHPERVNCRQCHAIKNNEKNVPEIWTR